LTKINLKVYIANQIIIKIIIRKISVAKIK